MSTLRSLKRKLDPKKVWLATQVAEEKIKIARQVVIEQAKKDAVFAAEILKVAGDRVSKEVKAACEEGIAHARAADDGNPIAPEDTIHGKQITQEEALAGLGDPSTWEETSKEVKEEFERKPIVGGDTSHELTEAIQLDGGGVIMVRPEEVPGHSTDGEKIVMMEGPKLEKA